MVSAMAVTTNPIPELLTLKHYSGVSKAPDGSDAWAATATLMQPSGLSTRPVKGGVGVATVNIAVSLNASASWILTSHAEDAQLVEHERLHYMLAICIARSCTMTI
jgi:hypothetical protein